ncbi:hypothetical protein R6Q59_018875 [Mikania micrantha]
MSSFTGSTSMVTSSDWSPVNLPISSLLRLTAPASFSSNKDGGLGSRCAQVGLTTAENYETTTTSGGDCTGVFFSPLNQEMKGQNDVSYEL